MHLKNGLVPQLPEPEDLIFSGENKSYIDLLEFFSPPPRSESTTESQSRQRRIADEVSLKEHLINENFIRRVATIYQPFSWAPLNVSRSMIQLLLALMDATPDIWDLILSFRAHNSDVEQGFSVCSWQRHKAGRELVYVSKYAEQKTSVEGDDTWVIRQVGLYHRYSIDTEQSSWILALPNHESYSPEQVADMMATNQHPLQPHINFHFANLHKWRWYMADLEKSFQKLAMDICNVEIEETLEFEAMYYQLSSLRSIERRLAPLIPIFVAYEGMLSQLKAANNDLRIRRRVAREVAGEFTATLDNFAAKVHNLGCNVRYLLSSVSSTIQTASETISLKSQNATEVMSNRMLSMSNRMVSDSATIRIITVVTVLYLPASFVSGLFGMGFFGVSNEGTWTVSPAMWVYFVVAFPVSAMTLLYWKLKSRRVVSRVESSLV